MNRDSIDEMEQIQRGLEHFLEQELEGYEKTEQTNSFPTREDGANRSENLYDTEEYWDGPEKNWDGENWDEDHIDRKRQRSQKPVKHKKGKPFRNFLLFLLIVCILLGGLWYRVVSYSYDQMTYSEIGALTSAPMKDKGVTNILLVGNDSRSGGEDGRSDAMILLSIHPGKRTIYMTSLLRDMYVEIPGHDGNRLNAAYAYGGPELLMETIEQNLDIEVNRYVLVNFRAFANLVDAVGGVDLELSNEEVLYVNGYLVEYNIIEGRNEGQDYMDENLSGMVHLNGAQALAYSRNRYIGTDFARTERQRKVLSQVMKKLPRTALLNPKGLIDSLFPNLTTNLTKSESLGLSLFAWMLPGAELVQGSVPVEGSYSPATIRKMSVLEVDFEKNKAYLQETIYGGK